MVDYITIRIQETPNILSNITPLSPSHGGNEKRSSSSGNNTPSSSPQHPYTDQDEPSPLAQSRFTQYLTDTSKGCFLFVKLVSVVTLNKL